VVIDDDFARGRIGRYAPVTQVFARDERLLVREAKRRTAQERDTRLA
jgi:hypothetical protein